MGLLYRTKTYLIGHMQYLSGRDWREKVKAELTPRGITVFDPYNKPFLDDTPEDEATRAALKSRLENEEYDFVSDQMKPVRNYDLRLCDLSDFLIANIVPDVASWGSAEELVTACRMKKAVFISIEGGKKKCPLWIFGMFPHKYIYNNINEVIDMIKKIDDGEKKIDSDRWRLLKEEYR